MGGMPFTLCTIKTCGWDVVIFTPTEECGWNKLQTPFLPFMQFYMAGRGTGLRQTMKWGVGALGRWRSAVLHWHVQFTPLPKDRWRVWYDCVCLPCTILSRQAWLHLESKINFPYFCCTMVSVCDCHHINGISKWQGTLKWVYVYMDWWKNTDYGHPYSWS